MHTATTAKENDFKLTGRKIKLTAKPVENLHTASARSALLTKDYTRPVSVVPLLNLNYNEFNINRNTRRPLSADFPTGAFRVSPINTALSLPPNKCGSSCEDDETSRESSEESVLPSSQLLQDLLDEPLYSWRNGVRTRSFRKNRASKKGTLKSNDKLEEIEGSTSAGSDTSSSADSLNNLQNKQMRNTRTNQEKSSTPTLKEMRKVQKSEPIETPTITITPIITKPIDSVAEEDTDRSCHKFDVSEADATNPNSMSLIPGLKTKPPLPKKLDLSSAKASKRSSPCLIPNDNISTTNDANFEKITLSMLDYNLQTTHNGYSNKHSCDNMNIKEENINIQQVEQGTTTCSVSNSQASSSTLISDNEEVELKFQTWYKEEENAANEILESEFKTDLSLHKLKMQNQNTETGEKSVVKAVNFENDLVVSNKSCNKRSQSAKNFIKENIKSISNCAKKSSPMNSSDAPKPSKFTPTCMKSFRDSEEISNDHDVESWMSENKENLSCVGDAPDARVQTNPATFTHFLEEIDKLQEPCTNSDVEETNIHAVNHIDSNTYDDIVSILQVLEEQDEKSHKKMQSMKEIIISECSSTSSESNEINNYANANNKSNCFSEEFNEQGNNFLNCGRFSNFKESFKSSLNSTTNLNDIFSYLDEVDKSCAKSLINAKERIQSTAQVLENNIKLDTIPKLEELLAYTNVELSHYIVDLSLRLKEKSSSIAILQKELSTLRNQITKMSKDTNDVVKQKLKSQKDDYENVVKRHQKFIDQLIADKKTLNQQCEGLIQEIKMLEDRYNSNLKTLEHKHKIEVQKVKDMQAAGEKMRKERWIDTKTKKIKELTVKGLEPELEKMAARHQQELTDLRALHKREIEDLELRAARKMQQHCETLREQLIEERERALAHEREVLKQRHQQLVEMEEKNYQEQRRRLLLEHANRVAECEERENSVIMEKDRAIKQARSEFEDKLQATIRRHNSELRMLKEKTELEIETFRNNYKKQAAAQLAEKEAQIRERCKKERDREIEAVIERLETESNENKALLEQSAENRVKRLKEKFEKEIKDLELSEMEATNKYSEAKSKLIENEDLVINLKGAVKQLETQLVEAKGIAEKLTSERSKIKELMAEEMRTEMQSLETETQKLRDEKDKELQHIYSRVKVAVARKDEALSELTRDHAALQEKCVYLENMLEQQRKEYLTKEN